MLKILLVVLPKEELRIPKILVNHFKNKVEIKTCSNFIRMRKEIAVYDVLIIDLDIRTDMNIIEFVKRMVDIKVIFISSSDTRVQEAFGINVCGFVLKNKINEELVLKIKEIITCIATEKIVYFDSGSSSVKTSINDIIYCQYLGDHKIGLVTINSTYILKGTTLKDMYIKLQQNFIYLNRATIANKKRIHNFRNNSVELLGVNSSFDVSHRNIKKVKQHLYTVSPIKI